MNINLFIHYELVANNESAILESIQSLGNVTRLANGFWYINSTVDAKEALKRISSWMSESDRTVVIDANNNQVLWYNLDEKVAQRIKQNWLMSLGPVEEDSAKNTKEVAVENTPKITEH